MMPEVLKLERQCQRLQVLGAYSDAQRCHSREAALS